MEAEMTGEVLVPGVATGELLVSKDPLSFWGGYDAGSGEIIDRRHPLSGALGKGRILAIPGSRGSSTTTAVLIEAFRLGNAPAGFLVTDRDTFLSLAAVVADEMYEISVPGIMLTKASFAQLTTGEQAHLSADGRVVIAVGAS